MLSVPLLSILSVVGVSLLSLLGILFFLFEDRFIQKILLYLVSFSTGALLGDVFLHMIPEMAKDQTFLPHALMMVLLGILFSFIVEKVVHWRHCHIIEHGHTECHPVGILSLVGESLHNFIDGIVIAAAYIASPSVGIATTLAVVFHEIPHEIGNFAVLLHSGFTKKRALLFNVLSACMAIVGAIATLLAQSQLGSISRYMLPFAAGNLLYIAGSDLIPELHKHSRFVQSVLQLIGMLAGMAVMYGITLFE